LHVSWNVTTSEDELLSGVGCGRVDLDGDEVGDQEEDQESPKDAEVAPNMAPGVRVRNLDEAITVDKRLSSNCTLSVTDERVAICGVSGT